MSDMLNIGSSALLAYRTALNVVSQNIANANTTGYSRQRVDLQSVPGATSPNASVGNGVTVQTVQRLGDGFLQQQLVADDSSYNRINTFQTYAAQADSLLSAAHAGLSAPLQQFATALNGLASDPSSSAARQTLLSSAQSLSGTFNSLQQQLSGLEDQSNSDLSTAVGQINTYASQLATLNGLISQATAQGNGQQPNDLLDQRDQLLRNLGSAVGISTTSNADGSVNVFVGNGQALVLGNTANSMSLQPDVYGQSQDLVLNSGSTKTVVTNAVSGGNVGGLLDVRREVLDPAMNQLGQLATAMASAVNAQHAQGMDQYGQLGGALFTQPLPQVSAASSNSGSASVAASVSDASALGTSDYVLKFDGSQWSLSDRSSGATVPMTGAGTSASPFKAAGVSLVVSGSAAAGDRYLVQPTHSAAAQIGTAITDVRRIAAASPVQTKAVAGNSGSGTIGSASVLDASNSALLSTATIQFTSASTYSVNGAGSYAYVSGGDIDVNGLRVQISGVPANGDSFTLSANSGSSGDNSNAKALAALGNAKLLNGGTDTFSTANASLVSQTGAAAASAQSQLTAQGAIRDQAQTSRDSMAGVNLDEEAADMMRFQQAYQAAAQVIATSNTLFQSLLSAVHG